MFWGLSGWIFLFIFMKIKSAMNNHYLTLILILLAGFTAAQQNRSFQFVESSSGMHYPSWESGMTELEFADINMDGYVDILSIGDHGSPNINAQEHGIMVWFGDGTGTWSVQMVGNFGYGGIAIGDVNNDGHWDVGYGMHHAYSSTDLGDQLLEVALGDGSGINWTPWDDGLATNGEDWGLFGTDFADVDNDGDLDIGTNSFGSGSGLHVYINQGDGTWEQSFGIMPGNSNMRFVFGDINRDGNADFVVTHDAGIAFFGDGEGNFTNADYNLPQYGFPMNGPDLGDVNNDGGQDLAYVDNNGGILVWIFSPLSNQWINVSGALPSSGNYQELQLCDFNSDGVTDLAAFGDAQLTIWKNTLFGPQNIVWTQEFNTITSDNGDCNAFRAGGDVDRNGYPDITLVEKEGSWPSDQNHLKCFKETTPLIQASIKAVFPKGHEVFRQGSVQFADWISAVSPSSQATVRIDYSLQGKLGPWTELTSGTANSGRFQWIIPQTISSNNCFIKYTLNVGGDTLEALTNKAFIILGEDGIEADFIADSTTVYPGSTIQFTDQSLGLITSWEWDFENDGIIDATTRNPEFPYSQSGTYTVKLSVSDGSTTQAEVKTDYITVLSPVGLRETDEGPGFFIYPNPTDGKFQITNSKFQINSKFKIQNARIEVVDLYGKLVMCSPLHRVGEGPGVGAGNPQPATRNLQLDLSHLPAGLYLVRITYGTSIYTQKLIIY